jgi:acyl-CoA oxidase
MATRLNVINSHFAHTPQPNPLDLHRAVCINTSLLQHEYNSPYPEITSKFISEINDNPLYDIQSNLEKSREQQREITVRQILHIYPKFLSSFDFTNSNLRSVFTIALSGFDMALSTRMTVHLMLYLESIEFLGTEKHRAFIEKALKLQEYGSFSMTELGHGSNVSGVETTATFDPQTREFVLNSPTVTSVKWWIGAMANTCNMTVCFAQLVLNGQSQGVHVFLVRVRDEQHNPVQGVTIGDCGPKAGLAGVDNGFVFFNNLRVPYDNLLDRMSWITPEGKFKSLIKSPEKRFGIMLSGLTGGRTGIIGSAELNMRHALTIAIRYACVRKQFGKPERPIITYALHRHRLMPYLSKTFAARVCVQLILKLYLHCKDLIKVEPESLQVAEMHILLSVFKFLICKWSQTCIQECREACGGHGYSAFSAFARLRENNDIHATWDGDNNVLVQQCSRFLLKHIMHYYKGNPEVSKLISFFNAEKPELTAETLKKSGVLIELLEFRARFYMQKAMSRLQGAAGKDQSVAWDNSQANHFHSLSQSFGELVAAKELLGFGERLKEKCAETGRTVEGIFRLFVLSSCEKEHFGLSEAENRLLEEAAGEQCDEVAKGAVKVLDAIAYSDFAMQTVLGCSDGLVYERYIREVERAEKCYGKPEWIHLVGEMKKAIR